MSGLCYGGYHYCIILDRMQRKLSVICKLPWFQTAVCLILLGVVFWGFSFYFYRSGKKRQKKQEIYEQVIPEEKTESKEFEVGTEITESPENMTGSEDNNELTVLLAECEYKEERCLVSADRKKTVISLTEFPFVIGKLEGVVDYVLTDKSVSRMHVKFMYHEDDDTVYMQDLNSTNGTYHNGIRLEGDEILPVYAQDEIRIGKRVFVYQ